MDVLWGGQCDLLAKGLDLVTFLVPSLSFPLSLSPAFTSTLVFAAPVGENLLPLLSALLGGDRGGLRLSTCVGL